MLRMYSDTTAQILAGQTSEAHAAHVQRYLQKPL